MDRNIEEDMFAELYYQGTLKRLKEVANSRLNYQAYAVITHLHRVLRNPIVTDATQKKLKVKIKRLESCVKKINKSKSKKDLSLCTFSDIMTDCKNILGETIFNISSTDVFLPNLEPHLFDGVLTIRPSTPLQTTNAESSEENTNGESKHHI